MLQQCVLAFAPGLFWLWYFRRKDDLEPEPRHRLIWAFVAGCGGACLTLWLRPFLDGLLPGSDPWWSTPVDAYLLTAAGEEAVKLLAFFLAAYWHKEFDEPLDGVMYGIAVALGFASLENLLYLQATGRPGLMLERAFTSVLAHVAFTGTLGYFFGVARFSRRSLPWMAFGLVAAVILHGTYDYLLLLGEKRVYLALLVVLPLSLVILGLSIRWHRARSAEYHGEA